MTDPHPWHCRMCRGTGWIEGPPIHAKFNGVPYAYSTVAPCEHKWWNDDPSERDDRWLAQSSEQAQAAIACAYAQGVAELDAIRSRKETP